VASSLTFPDSELSQLASECLGRGRPLAIREHIGVGDGASRPDPKKFGLPSPEICLQCERKSRRQANTHAATRFIRLKGHLCLAWMVAEACRRKRLRGRRPNGLFAKLRGRCRVAARTAA
jgi:hypothetical protein